MRKIAAHYLFDGYDMVPDPVITVGDDGAVVCVESIAQRDRLSLVEFYSGILMPGIILPAVDIADMATRLVVKQTAEPIRMTDELELSVCRTAEFLDASMWSQGVQVVGDIGICDMAGIAEIKKRSPIIYTALQNDVERGACNSVCHEIIPEQLRSMAVDMLIKLYGTDVVTVLNAAAGLRASCIGYSEELGVVRKGSSCGMALLTGVDYDSMAFTRTAITRRIL